MKVIEFSAMPDTELSLKDLEQQGFLLIKSALSDEQIEFLTGAAEAVRRNSNVPGLRNLLSKSSAIKEFATEGLAGQLAQDLLGVRPLPVRGILFDKTADSNWYVTWHQDVSIPVRNRVELTGYGPWSTKDGILHVQPTASILEKMVSLRIHLDNCPENNGAIKFIAGSHKLGVLDSEQQKQIKESSEPVTCAAERGDIIAMRPLIMHSSSESEVAGHRRVLHLEYAGTDLPAELAWGEA